MQRGGCAALDGEPESAVESNGLSEPQLGFLDWCLTVPFLAAFVACLFFFDLSLRLFPKRHDSNALAANRWLVKTLRITGATLSVEGAVQLPTGQPLIVVSNHQSLMDIPILGALFGRHYLRYISKRELGRWLPFVSANLRMGGHALIDRSDAKQSLAEIQRLSRAMAEQGFGASIFPEGTRARCGELKAFRGAGVLALMKAVPDAPIIPVTIDGSWKLAVRKLMPVPRNVRLKVVIGEPISREEGESGAQLVQRLHDIIAANLARLRAGTED